MRTARVKYQGQVYQVEVGADLSVVLPTGQCLQEHELTWLPPSRGTLYALELNYADHAGELAFNLPQVPLIFVKTNNSLVGHNQHTCRPDDALYMHYECELVVVIGKTAKYVRREEALSYVAGYTLCNDYCIRDYLENYYRPNLRVKNRYASTPIGPYILAQQAVPKPDALTLKTWVNGVLRQQGSSAEMIFDVPYLIEYLSGFLTLAPGDMIATGTPQGRSNVVVGDEVVVEIEGIGRLRNTLVSEREFFESEQFSAWQRP